MGLHLPFSRDTRFVGRDSILKEIDNNGVTIICGPSGTGKTHIVVEHAYRIKEQNPENSIVWLDSNGFWRLELSIKKLIQSLDIHRATVDGLKLFLPWYSSQSSHSAGLLVLDDLSFDAFPEKEKKGLVEFLNNFDPKFGRVLITTRLEWSTLVEMGIDSSKIQPVHLGPFSEDEVDSFLATRLPKKDSWTEQETILIRKSLKRSPFALKLTTALWSACVIIDDDNEEEDEKEDNWQHLKDQMIKNTAGGTFELILRATINQVARENDKAYQMLCSMSVLDTQGVPLSLLYTSWAKTTSKITLAARRALRLLRSFSLIQCSSDGYQYFMHEPISKYLQKRLLQAGALTSYQQNAIEDTDAAFDAVRVSTIWQTADMLIPHIQKVITYKATNHDFKKSKEALLCKFGDYLTNYSKYSEALTHYCEAEKICKDIYGETNLRTLEVSESVAYGLWMTDKPNEAAKVHKHIEKVYAQVFPRDHWRRLQQSGAYGAVFIELGKWKEAEQRLLQGIQGARKLYGAEHRNGMTSRNSLVRLYGMIGEYDKARELCEEILEIYRRDLPETHPNVFRMMSNLGTALTHLGRYQEAIVKQKKALKLAERSLEATPQNIFDLRKALALSLSNSGNIIEAVEHQRQLVALCPLLESQPGENTLTSHINLGVTLERLSLYDEAEKHLKQALLLCAGSVSSDPTLLRVRNNLALVSLRQGNLVEAESQYRDLLKLHTARHPNDPAHPDIVLMQNNLGGALQRQGEYAEAIKVQREVLRKIMSKPDAAENRSATFARNNLAESLRMWAEQGCPDDVAMLLLAEAEKLHREALKQREEQFGEAWQTWTSKVNLGMVLQAQGKPEEAKLLYSELDKLIGSVGEKNLTVILVREKLAALETTQITQCAIGI